LTTSVDDRDAFDLSEAQQALLDTLTGTVVLPHDGNEIESTHDVAFVEGGVELDGSEHPEPTYSPHFEAEVPIADQLQQYPEDVSLHQAQKLSATDDNPESGKADMDMEQLRAEVKRLKEHVRRLESTDGAMAAAAAQTLGQLAAMTFPGGVASDHIDHEAETHEIQAGPSNYAKGQRQSTDLGGESSESSRNELGISSRSTRKRKVTDRGVAAKREIVPMNDSTGKRMVIRARTDHLAVRAARSSVRDDRWGVSLTDMFLFFRKRSGKRRVSVVTASETCQLKRRRSISYVDAKHMGSGTGRTRTSARTGTRRSGLAQRSSSSRQYRCESLGLVKSEETLMVYAY
jgi:hypothetical protein